MNDVAKLIILSIDKRKCEKEDPLEKIISWFISKYSPYFLFFEYTVVKIIFDLIQVEREIFFLEIIILNLASQILPDNVIVQSIVLFDFT